MQKTDSFICKLSPAFLGILSKDMLSIIDIQVFFEVLCSAGSIFNYLRLVLTLLHANVKAEKKSCKQEHGKERMHPLNVQQQNFFPCNFH